MNRFLIEKKLYSVVLHFLIFDRLLTKNIICFYKYFKTTNFNVPLVSGLFLYHLQILKE